MPMTWDSASQAFVEAEIPATYDPAIDAWEDTEGYEHNHGLDAWEKVWPTNKWLYKDGNECADVTGGWVARGFCWNSTTFIPANPTLAKNSDNMYFYLTYNGWRSGGISTANKIDLTNFNTIKVLNTSYCSGRTEFSEWCDVLLLDNFSSIVNRNNTLGTLCNMWSNIKTEKVTELDISGISGEKYIVFGMAPDTGSTSAENTVQTWIKRVWMEK